MDGKNRAASSYLSPGNPPADKEQNDPLAQVFHNACSYNFFAMAELLHRLAKGEKGTPELSLRDDPAQETLRFSADASLAFPCSDISALKRDTSGAFRMTTTFMGLQGSQSPLPGYYLDHLAWKAVHEQSPVGDFLDMFSHRLTQFVWHIWRKYRYHISFRNGGVDAFSQRMYSLVGLGHRQLRDKLAINHSKMLAYSGILANPGRSPEIICGLVSHCFDLSEVTLQNWQRRKVDIEPDQQNSLGSYSLKNGEKLAGRSVLGNFVLGTADKRRREHLLQTLRSRLQDIRQHLHCQLPVYVVLTRLDLLQGFAALFQSLNRQDRDAILGVTFTRRAHENDDWRTELNAFWQTWVDRMNLALPDLMVAQTHTRTSLFSFSRQMQGSREPLVSLLEGLLDGENMNVMLRGVYLTSSLQRGQMDDIFTQSAARQYRLGNNPLASWPLVDTAPYFTRSLFPQALLAEPNLATESRAWLIRSRRRLTVFSATGGVAALLLITGWHHYYNGNYQSGITVLKQAKAFMDVPPPQGEDDFGNLQLPLLNPVRDATLAYGDWGDRSRLADMGLYQGRRIGPYVEQTYLQLLEQRYLPSLFNGLVKAMNAAPPESEEKLAVLRVMRMLEDKSGRNNEVVKQYMAKRWSEKFHGQRDIQAQLMSHLDYALAHTDWHAERQAGDGDAISRWTPYDKPVVSAQKELSKLPVYQRVYQSLKTRALGVLPADLNLRDQVGPTFDQVFTSADDNKLVVPQFLTRYGLQSYFVKQRDELVELTAMDSWVLNLTRSVKYSDADRAEIQRQLTEQYISDYTATWRAGMDNLNIRNFESIGQLTGALEQVISGDQPLQRALTVLRDNTQPGVFSEKLSAKEREEALAEPDYQLLTRLGHEFAPENSTLAVQKDKESTMQAVYQQLTELHRYLLAIQNAPVPGKSALKAVQLRLDQNSSDPIFATRQMAKTLPAPLNRWVGRLTDQAWHVVMVEAVHYMEVDWRDSVVKPFNEQLANNYPFNPRSAQDASLDAFERFFKPDGILDTFYQQNLKLFIDNDLSLEDGDNNVIIREDIIAQLETAQKIRDIFFSKQNGLGTSFAVETVSLSGNKRRSVLNLDGQLVDYSQGRNYTAHLVWPNNMREGNESKLTLIGTSGNAPRSISFSGPWAQFRLFGAGQLTGVQDGNFTVRFSVDGGAMTYRVHTDTEDNPFSGGLFSQFGLSDTLY